MRAIVGLGRTALGAGLVMLALSPTMPPPKATAQPTDAERKTMLDWLARGSPNTPTGQ